ncbi:MAG TPA: protein phosphatase 2C domain-containing protein [Gemmatimonadales bacterium]
MAAYSPPADAPPGPKPRDEDLDFFGLTHPGRVRKENQDHFLYCTLHKTMRVWGTSLPNPELLELPSQRLASFGLVADGVGGRAGGETASRAALEAIATYVTHTMQAFYTGDSRNQDLFLTQLTDGARRTHDAVVARARESGEPQGPATTLTAMIAIWPNLFVLHVGDSRCYRFRDGVIQQLTRDQTMAQDLVDSGVLPADRARKSPFAHVLSSSLGGQTTEPVVTKSDLRLGDVIVMCTDGLTKHVSDERIAERLRTLQTSEQACRDLVEEALEAGGSDNVTVLVLRAIVR